MLFAGRDETVRALDPRRIPVGAAFRGWVPRWRVLGRSSIEAHPLLATSAPRARRRDMEVRGVATAALVYDHVPVLDAFRRVGDEELLGLMDRRGDVVPFLFRLRRQSGPGAAAG